MASKRRGGFKPPANYEPNRKPKSRRGAGYHGRPQGSGSATERGAADRGSVERDPNGRIAGKSAGKSSARIYAFDRAGVAKHDRSSATDGRVETGPPGRNRREAPERQQAPELVLDRLEAQLTTAADVEGVSFGDLGLGPNLVRVLGEMGADRPFPIQAATIPDALRGRDVLGRARTGSGKTIAFGAALVERLLLLKADGAFADEAAAAAKKPRRGERQQRAPKRPTRKPKALILAPTRELALQIDRTVQPLARSVGFYTAQLVGGVPIDPQVHALERGVDIVIGTPGRVEDLVNRRKLDLRGVRVTVVDEADHMCDLGFLEPVQRVLRGTARGGQRLLFSATLDTAVSQLVAEFLRDPAVHEVADVEAAAADIEHSVLVVMREHKDEVLVELTGGRDRVLVFCRTRAYAERVLELLTEAGIRAVALHGDLKQHARERNLERFASGRAGVLVATDVAARGIHVDDVDLVLQADPPDDYKTYLHRSGRTGRAGKKGRAITVIPRNRQKRTREVLENAGVEAAYFGDFVPGQKFPR
ncbi:MAG: DEAD/DEAH box helicase [Leucobacter sp.]